MIPSGIVTTAWPRVVAKCAEVGVSFDQWQHGIGSVALGKRKDGKYAATVGGIVLSIPRQVGKTFLVGMIIIALALIYPGMTILWTAHRTRTATMTFHTLRSMVSKPKIRPHLAAGRSEGIRTANGEQEIRFRNGSVIMFGAREQGFGRGFANVDVEVFDEAQILTEKALEDMVPATNQSRQAAGPLLFFMGTPPRSTDPGEEFANRRAAAISGKTTDAVYVEFSADADADPDDHAQWRKANVSFPHRTPVESMQRMRAQLTDDDSFRREALGIWDPTETARVISEADWNRAADTSSMAIDRLCLAIDVAPDRSKASVSLAGLRPDGRWHVELDDERSGTDWIGPWITARAAKNRLHAVVADELSGMVEKKRERFYLKGTNVRVTVAGAEGRDMAIACAKFYDGVIDETVHHTDQPQANVSVSVARKRPVGSGWAWNRRDATSDITPIVSMTLALWGAQNENVDRPTRRTGGRTGVML